MGLQRAYLMTIQERERKNRFATEKTRGERIERRKQRLKNNGEMYASLIDEWKHLFFDIFANHDEQERNRQLLENVIEMSTQADLVNAFKLNENELEKLILKYKEMDTMEMISEFSDRKEYGKFIIILNEYLKVTQGTIYMLTMLNHSSGRYGGDLINFLTLESADIILLIRRGKEAYSLSKAPRR